VAATAPELPALHTRCCIAGGGPAGMMLGLLLARAGVPVVVLEKHADFLRDFRGDTIHPSTLELMHELGLLEALLQRPHQKAHQLGGEIEGERVTIADFSHLPTRCKFVAFMPQWEFLDFLAQQAKAYPAFTLRLQAEVTDLLRDGEHVAGVQARTAEGMVTVKADLVVAADGRHSTVRQRAGLTPASLGAPIDVLWMRLSRHPEDSQQSLGRISAGHLLVMIDRGDYWQCAFVIPKGGFEEVRARGIEALREDIAAMAPDLRARLEEIGSWDDVKLLTVAVDRLPQWHRPGLLCIGDAAHAMSPIGGVGINLAIQDAVATANRLAAPLAHGGLNEADLQAVQQRRSFPTRATQRIQVVLQERVIRRVLVARGRLALPFPLKLLRWFPILRRLPARLIGMGLRPEHVSPAIRCSHGLLT
jgi:2-polyprenyl-6-methoxyphenol hydroxylase-like FAD-dependent oxidoreductase